MPNHMYGRTWWLHSASSFWNGKIASIHTAGFLVLALQKLCKLLPIWLLEAAACNSSNEQSNSSDCDCQHGVVGKPGIMQQRGNFWKRVVEDLPATKALPLPSFALLANLGIVGGTGACPAVEVPVASDRGLLKAILEIVIAEREGP